MSLPLAGKVALVTGSSRSIGAAIVRRLADDGASVVINYLGSAESAHELVQHINTEGKGTAVAIKADVSSTADGSRLVEETVQHFGRLDILVLNAGIMRNGALGEISEGDYDEHFDINVKAPLFMVKAASSHLQRGGRIVFFSSSTTKFSSIGPTYVLYAATKGAVEQLTRVLAKDFGAKGTTVNCVAPGPVDTEMFRNGKTEELIGSIASLHPQNRIAESDEIAPIVAFLSREEAEWVNGQTIFVNGGFAV